MQQLSEPDDFATEVGHDVVRFPTRSGVHLPTDFSAQVADLLAADPPAGIRTYAIRDVFVLEVGSRLSDVVKDLDRALQMALAEGPHGVVCDLTAVLEWTEPGAVEVLAAAGRYVRNWPGIPVALACPDQVVREFLAADPMGEHLILTASMFSAVSAVLATPTVPVERLRLTPDPTSARGAAREFVAATLLGWNLETLTMAAGLVTGELVSSAMIQAVTDIEVSVAWNLGELRLTVRDDGPGLPPPPYAHDDPHGRKLSVVAVLSRAFGVLPTVDGGKVVWAVLNAAGSRPPRQ